MASYGKVAVLASAATAVVPVTAAGVADDLAAVMITNNGPNTIWVGNDNAVTTGLGTPIPSGQSVTFDRDANNGIWAIASTADQVSPADTRWLGELRSGG